MLTNQDAWKLYAAYVEGWKAVPDDERTRIANEVLAETVAYTTPRHASGGRATVIADMVAFQTRVPGGHFDVGDVSAHHDVALVTWVMINADGTEVARGHDQFQVQNGRMISLITFAPSVTNP